MVETEKIEHKVCSTNQLRARCNSFVVETDVHHSTDINLLFDFIRKTIEEFAKLSKACQLTD